MKLRKGKLLEATKALLEAVEENIELCEKRLVELNKEKSFLEKKMSENEPLS